MSDTPRPFPRPTEPPPLFDDLDDTQTVRRKERAGLDYLIETQRVLVAAHHERKGSERVIKGLLAAALAVGIAVAGGVIAMKTDQSAQNARIQDITERLHDLAETVREIARGR